MFFLKGEDDDETEYAKMVINNSNLDPTYISPDLEDIIKDFERSLEIHGEATFSFSMFIQYFVFKAVKEKKNKVILDGQGADELFLGYQHYFNKYIRYLAARFR